MIRKIPLVVLFILAVTTLSAQQEGASDGVKKAIMQLFDGMRAGDSAMVSKVFMPDARMQTTFTNKEGVRTLREGSLERFLVSVGTPHEEVYDEKIWNYDIRVDDNLATAVTEYSFYLGDKLSHCGVNAFQLFYSPDGWKITHIADTRRKDNCQTEADLDKQLVNTLIDDWHQAAARADELVFFGSMTEDAIYIGTDASEYWLRDELRDWATAAFERESAWDFTASSDRHLYFSKSGQMAWWDEKLDTWMGICRGSGVAQKTANGWKIKHYHLSVTLPNDKIKEFKELVGKE